MELKEEKRKTKKLIKGMYNFLNIIINIISMLWYY